MKKVVPVLVAVALLPFATAVHSERKRFDRVLRLNNDDVNSTSLEVIPDADLKNCTRRCFHNSSCHCLRHHKGECTLYGAYCRETTDRLPPTMHIYYSEKDPCPVSEGYRSIMSPRLCFKLINDSKSWSDSKSYCNQNGGRLIVLDTPDKCDYINEYLKSEAQSPNTWIGIKRTHSQLTWLNEANSLVSPPCLELEVQVSPHRCGFMIAGSKISFRHHCSTPFLYMCEIPME